MIDVTWLAMAGPGKVCDPRGLDPDEFLSPSAVATLRIPHRGEYLVALLEQAPCREIPEARAGSSNENGFFLSRFRVVSDVWIRLAY